MPLESPLSMTHPVQQRHDRDLAQIEVTKVTQIYLRTESKANIKWNHGIPLFLTAMKDSDPFLLDLNLTPLELDCGWKDEDDLSSLPQGG